MKAVLCFVLIFSFSSCATTPHKRFLWGAGIGAGTGALGGAALSPDQESKGMNALVFGLTGAILGGIGALFFYDDAELPKSTDSLQSQEMESTGKEIVVSPQSDSLPQYVKDRLQPVVLEEFVQKDLVSEDGSLSEPHRVWRIKQPAELAPKPLNKSIRKQK